MNPLDRQIAEAKGLKIDLLGGISTDRPGVYTLGALWSESDAKALELVDELAAKGFRFSLRTAEVGRGWIVYFHNAQAFDALDGGGYTRPEAICRAYLAAMEWMKK